jgi:hypothetical protein
MYIFLAFRKNVLTESCSSSEDLSDYNISWSYVKLWKFYIHLRSLNLRHFGMVAATALETTALRSPWVAWPPYRIW